MENETLEQQNDGQQTDFETFVDSAGQNQVKKNNIDDKTERALDNASSNVENRMHDAILKAMDKMVIPRVELALRSITGSSGHGPISEVPNSDRRDFLGNGVKTPLMSTSSRLDLDTSQDRNDETFNKEDFEDGNFPASGSNYDRRAQAHHSS